MLSEVSQFVNHAAWKHWSNAFAFGWQFNHNVSGWIHGPEEVTVWFPKHWKIGKWWTCKLVNRELISPNKLPSTICWNSDGICRQNLQICCQWRCGLQSFARRTGNITLADRFTMRVCCEHISQAPRVISTWFCAEKIYFWSYADGCMKRVYRLNLQGTWPFHLPNRLIWCFAVNGWWISKLWGLARIYCDLYCIEDWRGGRKLLIGGGGGHLRSPWWKISFRIEGCSEEGRQIHPGHHREFVSKDQAHHQGREWFGNDGWWILWMMDMNGWWMKPLRMTVCMDFDVFWTIMMMMMMMMMMMVVVVVMMINI